MSAPIQKTVSRDAYIARRTEKLRAAIAKIEGALSNPDPRVTVDDERRGRMRGTEGDVVAAERMRSTLAGMDEELDAAIDAAGAEWDRAQRSSPKAEGRAERARSIEGALARMADMRARFSR